MTQEQYAFLITQLATLLTAAISVAMSYFNRKKAAIMQTAVDSTITKVDDVHTAINSRLSELITSSVAAALAAGVQQERDRADAAAVLATDKATALDRQSGIPQ